MSTTATHLLKKLERIQKRTSQYRSDRKKDILLGKKSSFKKPSSFKKFTEEEIETFKLNYQKKNQKLKKKRHLIIFLIVLISFPLTMWLLNVIFMYGVNS